MILTILFILLGLYITSGTFLVMFLDYHGNWDFLHEKKTIWHIAIWPKYALDVMGDKG